MSKLILSISFGSDPAYNFLFSNFMFKKES